jgi:diguanylate cyclase (GGDEF)-like protein
MNSWVRIGKKINNHFEYNSKFVPIVWGCFLSLLIGVIDFQVNPDISLSIFYVIPIGIISWFVGKEVGFLVGGLSALTEISTTLNLNYLELKSAAFYWNIGDKFLFYSLIVYLLYSLRCYLYREKQSARIDETTGLVNKRLFLELARIEAKKAYRYRHPITAVYIDIDNFKNINDNFGYDVGDKLLQTVAETIKFTLRETDIITRIGGDEFILLLPGNGYESAHVAIQRIQDKLLETMYKHQWPVTFSIGAVTFIKPPDSVEEMIQRADYLMYLVKTNGKNQINHQAVQGDRIGLPV